ncbi:phage major capsid protein [Psychromarinibacter sp. C21-152]|uniref:Phage major capsid protein n=2 Tax=Psychromarinibacter sediminicola TaxID=3033385 RepID=A0AAE3T7N9_9RHOB|nr:phage major capsid protein [Psychromarinibacter sediminicola]
MRSLRAARAEKVELAKALVEAAETEGRSMTADEKKKFEEHMGEAESLGERVASAERLRETEAAMDARMAPRGHSGRLGAAADEFRSMLRGETRAMSTSTGADGGYAVPLQIAQFVTTQVKELSPVRRVARVVQTETQDYRALLSVRGEGSGWVTEEATRTTTDSPQLIAIEPKSAELYAYPKVSAHVIDDASFDVERFLSDHVATEFAYQEGAAFVNGDAVAGKPRGFLQYTTSTDDDDTRSTSELQHVVTGVSGGLSPDSLIDTLYALSPSYRTGPGVAWMMASNTIASVRKLKDGEGNYLWRDGFGDQPASLLGFPVVEANDMPAVSNGNTPIAFGNWQRGYLIAERVGMRMVRDDVTAPGFVKFYFARRIGGCVYDPNAIKLLKVST